MKKLNFGCGSIQPDGWDNVDIENFGQRFLGSTELFADNTYDIIVAHCTLQITEWHKLPDLLKQLRRIMKPGGVLRISLPDIIQGFEAYKRGDIEWLPNSEMNIDERFSAWLTWYSTTRTLLTPAAIRQLLFKAGFDNVAHVPFGTHGTHKEAVELDTRKGECYFIEARK